MVVVVLVLAPLVLVLPLVEVVLLLLLLLLLLVLELELVVVLVVPSLAAAVSCRTSSRTRRTSAGNVVTSPLRRSASACDCTADGQLEGCALSECRKCSWILSGEVPSVS